MHRNKMVAANWKMNLDIPDGEKLIEEIVQGMPKDENCEVVIAPPFTHLQMMASRIQNSGIWLAAQNCHYKSSGAYTGEISVDMLRSFGVRYCIAGHSERRQLFNETNDVVRQKVDAILEGGLVPIFCCGETLDIRKEETQAAFVEKQLVECIYHLEASHVEHLIIAYEPIWAIGTGMTASPEQVREMHTFIRKSVADRYGERFSQVVRILYGGSIKADNAESLFSQPDVDGGLVGGASLDATGFLNIIRAACG